MQDNIKGQSKLYVAPMLDWTDRHCRFFHRLLTPHAVLYTEMLTCGALIHGDAHKYLFYDKSEQPLVLQLGGSEPQDLEKCAYLAKEYGYEEINLNCGCPSERVQKGAFGACLMQEPQLVAECLNAIQSTGMRVSVKHRIGIDNINEYTFVANFIDTLYQQTQCHIFIVHARNAILKGLSPKQNRDIPPLKYNYVYQLKQDFLHAHIIMNGGIQTLEDVHRHLQYVDGVMLGRIAYHQPYQLNEIEHALWQTNIESRLNIMHKMQAYAKQACMEQGVYLGAITRHMLGLYHGVKNSRFWRQHLSNHTILRAIKTEQDIDNFFEQAQKII
jgi:tRNA-dihydrouridine synthase A